MKKFYLLLLVLVGITNCSQPRKGEDLNEKFELVYSRGDAGAGSQFSLKFSAGDTLYFRNYKYNPNKEIKYLLLQKDQKANFNKILRRVKWMNFDSTYIQQGLQDGSGYKFVFKKDKDFKSVYIYGKEGPAQLYKLSNWIDSLKWENTQKFRPLNHKVDFGNLYNIVEPEIIIPKK